MAVQGSYSVNEGDNIPRKDSSFKSFICAMFVFLVIILTLFLIVYFCAGNKKSEPKNDAEVIDPTASAQSSKSNKIVMIQVPDPPPTTTKRIVDKYKTTQYNFVKVTNHANELEDYTSSEEDSNYIDENYGRNKPFQPSTTYQQSTETLFSISHNDQIEITSDKNGSVQSNIVTEDANTNYARSSTSSYKDLSKNIFGKDVTTDDYQSSNSATTEDSSRYITTNTDEAREIESNGSTTPSMASYFNQENYSSSVAWEDTKMTTVPSMQPYISQEIRTSQHDDDETTMTEGFTEDTSFWDGDTTIPDDTTEYFETRAYSGLYSGINENTMQTSDDQDHTTEFDLLNFSQEGETTQKVEQEETTMTEGLVSVGRDIDLDDDISTTTVYDVSKDSTGSSNYFMTDTPSSKRVFPSTRDSTGTETLSTSIEESSSPTPSVYKIGLAYNHSHSTDQPTEETDYSTHEMRGTGTTDSYQTDRSLFTFGMDRTCNTVECKDTASEVLTSMNHITEPCDEFYEFACGNSKLNGKETVNYDIISEINNDSYTSGTSYIGKLRDFFMSCVEYENRFNYTDRITQLKQLLSDIGSFEFVQDVSEEALADVLANMTLLQSNVFFDIGLGISNEAKFILQMTLPSQSILKSSIEQWSYATEVENICMRLVKSNVKKDSITEENLHNIYAKYTTCQIKLNWHLFADSVRYVLQELNIFGNDPAAKDKIIEIGDTINVMLANIFTSAVPLSGIREAVVKREYTVRKIEYLQNNYPIINWHIFFEKITKSSVPLDTPIQIYYTRHFDTIFKPDPTLDKRKMYNAMLGIIAHTLYQNTIIPKQKANRVEYCLDMSKQLMPGIMNVITERSSRAEYHKLEQNTKFVATVFQRLVGTLENGFKNGKWLDQGTRDDYIKKLNNLELTSMSNIDWFKNDNNLNIDYQRLPVMDWSQFQNNLIELMKYYRNSLYLLHGRQVTPKDLFSHFIDAGSEHPVSFYAAKFIALPQVFLLKAHRQEPDYTSMARIAFPLAKQILKHFDPTGIHYELHISSGVYDTYKVLESNTYLPDEEKLKDMYKDKFDVSLSLTERITDNAAIKLVLDSLSMDMDKTELLPWISSSYSREKIFFIAVAQEFCTQQSMFDYMLSLYESEKLPGKLRVDGMMFNSEDFAEKFGCLSGSGLVNQVASDNVFPYLTAADDVYDYSNYGLNTTYAVTS